MKNIAIEKCPLCGAEPKLRRVAHEHWHDDCYRAVEYSLYYKCMVCGLWSKNTKNEKNLTRIWNRQVKKIRKWATGVCVGIGS